MQRRTVVLGLGLTLTAVAAGLGTFGYRTIEERRFRAELDRAKQELLDGRHNNALLRLRALARRHPDTGEVHYLVGLGEEVRGRPDLAEMAWSRITPGDAPYSGLAAIQWAELDRERGRLTAAEDRLRAALARPGTHRPKVRWALVQNLAMEGRTAEARKLFADGLAEHPEPVEALKSFYKLEVDPFPIEAAREYFASAAKLAPDDDRVWLGRAHLAIRSGDFDGAQTLLKSCLERRPEDRPAWEMLLECGLEAERPDVVAQALEHLPSTSGDDGRASELRAWAARLAGDRGAERRVLERWLEREPANHQALERLAAMASEDGRGAEAAAFRGKRAELERSLIRYLRRLGSADADDHAAEMARLASSLGRRADAKFWAARAGRSGRAPAPGEAPAPARSLAEAFPDLVAALGSLAGRGPDHAGAPGPRPRFTDGAEEAGLHFVHQSGSAAGRPIPPVTNSGGAGLIDFDCDGRLDVFVVQSGRFPPDPDSAHGGDRLFRNRGDGTFEVVTERVGLGGARGFGHGVAVGDVDNDGFPDLFVTRWRSYALYRNRGDGTFEDATERCGLGGDRDWPTSAAFADLDGDGDLDLYVCHYLAWDEHDSRTCVDAADPKQYSCNPRHFPALPDHLFRNDEGRFVDATEEAGIVDRDGRGLGVVAADLDGDGRVDLFVANDLSANSLFVNRGGLRFEERAHEAGVAANSGGGYQAGMGVACGDVDGDGLFDLAVTNFYGESTSFFRNLGHGLFADQTASSGLKAPSRFLLGFGVAMPDVNNDGQIDLLTANGHVHDGRPLFPWKMPLQLLVGGPPGRFTDASREAGPPFETPHIARGLAVGDLDNDGRVDAVVQCQDEALVYLRNCSEAGHFLVLELEGTDSNRDGVGATVMVVVPDGSRQWLQRTGGGSYQSASSPRLHVGLGAATKADRVEVRWPSGQLDRFDDLPADACYRFREGDGRSQPLPSYDPAGRRRP